MRLHGIIPALLTPFDGTGEVNYAELKALVRLLIDEGADGFYVTGSTAECFLLSEEERMKVVDTVTAEVAGRVPVIAHVGQIGVRQAVRLAKAAEKSGVTAISSVPPFYYKFGFDEITDYYAALSDATSLPMVVYNFPQLSGVTITADSLTEIRKRCNVGGLKYTDMNMYEFEKIRVRFPDISLLFGRDEALLSALVLGADGAVGSTYNVMLRKFKRLYAAFNEGDIKTAKSIQDEACRVIDKIVAARDFAAEKYLLLRKGIRAGGCREPFRQLRDDEKAALDEVGDLN